jgi:hypothetical protein
MGKGKVIFPQLKKENEQMKQVKVILNVDEQFLKENGLTLENELGWLQDSGITVSQIIEETEKER